MKVKVRLNNNESIFKTPEILLEAMKSFRYIPFTYLMSPLEVLLTLQGSCHDQVMFELTEFDAMGLQAKAKFIIAVDEDGHGWGTHSFVVYEANNKWCWFENAWEDMRGIHEFDSYESLIDYVAQQFRIKEGMDKLYLSDVIPANHTIGEDLSQFVDICMTTANLI